jgi:hypothetical protein
MDPFADIRRAHAAVQATQDMYHQAARRRAQLVLAALESGVSATELGRALGVRKQTVQDMAAKGRLYREEEK